MDNTLILEKYVIECLISAYYESITHNTINLGNGSSVTNIPTDDFAAHKSNIQITFYILEKYPYSDVTEMRFVLDKIKRKNIIVDKKNGDSTIYKLTQEGLEYAKENRDTEVQDKFSWQQHISFTERTLRFINSEFRNQMKPNECSYYIRHHIISSDYPLLDIVNFKESINTAIVNGKKVDMKQLLVPLDKLSKNNIFLYNKSIKKIWNKYNGTGKNKKYKGLPIISKRDMGSTSLLLQTSEQIGYYLNADDNPNKKREVYNDELYGYCKEIHEYLKNTALKVNFLVVLIFFIRNIFVDYAASATAKALKVFLGFIFLKSLLSVCVKHHQIQELHKDKTAKVSQHI
jgi:hypothetical protein